MVPFKSLINVVSAGRVYVSESEERSPNTPIASDGFAELTDAAVIVVFPIVPVLDVPMMGFPTTPRMATKFADMLVLPDDVELEYVVTPGISAAVARLYEIFIPTCANNGENPDGALGALASAELTTYNSTSPT